MDLVSILIPTYNQPEFFRKALKSALNQDYPNIEIIVSDDSTDDRVKNVVDEFLQQPQKFPIKYFKHSSESEGEYFKGLGNYLNLLDNAQGEYISFLLHDDLIYPKKISTMIKYFSDDVSIITSNRDLIDENDVVQNFAGIKSDKDVEMLSSEQVGNYLFSTGLNFIGEPSVVVFRRKDIYENGRCTYNYFVGRCFPAHGDLPTWLDLVRKSKVVPFITTSLSAYRKHPQQNTAESYTNFRLRLEFADILATAYMNDVFIHDVKTLEQYYTVWLDNLKESLITDPVFRSYELEKFKDMDLLVNVVQAAENHDTDAFLKFATMKKSWED